MTFKLEHLFLARLFLVVFIFLFLIGNVFAIGDDDNVVDDELNFNTTSADLLKTLEEFTPVKYKANLTSISLKLDECYKLYHGTSSKALFFLEKSLRSKVSNITSDLSDIEKHIKLIEKGLDYAINFKPQVFRKEALLLLNKIPKDQLKKLGWFIKEHLSSMTTKGLIKSKKESIKIAELFPSNERMQQFFKNSVTLMVLLGSVIDNCAIDERITTQCLLITGVSIITSILWYFELDDILRGP